VEEDERVRYAEGRIVRYIDPLKCVQELVGPVKSWPIYNKTGVVEPCIRFMKNVTAFMYGNEVPVENAAKFYETCRRYQHTSIINEARYSWYYTWDRYSFNNHKVECYNICSKRVMWTNGKASNQEEITQSEVIAMHIAMEV
jgi:hypothetical protein